MFTGGLFLSTREACPLKGGQEEPEMLLSLTSLQTYCLYALILFGSPQEKQEKRDRGQWTTHFPKAYILPHRRLR